MDYVVGSVAALITGAGNTTPNRPRLVKRALTPTKHQPSPNVTPKSELVDDRSIFLSPTLQKKKAIVKKSPKRIFQNPDLDITNDGEGKSSLVSPKADKAKKHLKDDLEANTTPNNDVGKVNSPKKAKNNVDLALNKKEIKTNDNDEKLSQTLQVNNESTPKKKKKQRNFVTLPSEREIIDEKENLTSSECNEVASNETATVSTENDTPKKKKSKLQDIEKSVSNNNEILKKLDDNDKKSLKKNKKLKKSGSQEIVVGNEDQNGKEPTLVNTGNSPAKKKNKKRKKKLKKNQNIDTQSQQLMSNKEKKLKVNPNAITNMDTDSEHDSDDEINSDTEQTNKDILDTGPASSDDEQENEEVKKPEKNAEKDFDDAEVIKRTLFVGNVPFSKKCKKEIKKMFSKYGHIENVRIRGIPVKDARTTPKLAVIKSELHPERTSVNLYIKFTNPQSVDKALAENNTVLNGYHLRVSRSDTTGFTHDPKLSVFVGNLPFAIEDEGLRAKFESCGDIESVRIVRDKQTSVGKGFGFVNFKTKDSVELALALTEEDLTIKNRILRVQRCTLTQKGQGHKNEGLRNHGQRDQGQGQRNQGQRNWGQRNQGQNQMGQRNRNQMGQGHRNRGQMQQGQRNQGQMGQGQRHVNFKEQGAYRRVMNKRPREESDVGGPPNKKSKDFHTGKEKKPRQEFVGMTAEKKKKRKFDKGQKKKKAISEILSKKAN
ncbi:nucleolar protein 12 [Hyposmocoma kahamanoa]|uniref:nucleolar protein 12 n=1 Tax=Hyposmocoma kahamanoa TaxID=1477025 RepID=UPI000E6D68F2|nr:nucleolar protein 12 [Hyposmocoma kahamanoa]